MGRPCIFCFGDSGSGEHVWSDWLNDVLRPLMVDGDTHVSWVQQMADHDEVRVRTFHKSELANLETNQLCHGCNQQLGAQLESPARPLMAPMIVGSPATLDQSAQILVATWAVKTVMVLQSTFERGVQYASTDRDAIITHNQPPSSVQVFLAAIDHPFTHLSYSELDLPMPDENPPFGLEVSTLQLGALVLQVIRRSPPPTNHWTIERFAIPRVLVAPAGIAIPIFPPVDSANWPNPTVLHREALIKFARRGVEAPDEWAVPTEYPGPPPRTHRASRPR